MTDRQVNSIDANAKKRATRRALLSLGSAAAAGAVVGALLPGSEAEAHPDGGHFESDNSDPALHGDNTDSGPGVLGTSLSRSGVRATSETGNGVSALSAGAAVSAILGQNVASPDEFTEPVPQLGSGPGVTGRSGSGAGVSGTSESATGVIGRTEGSTSNGVFGAAVNDLSLPSSGTNLGAGTGVSGSSGSGSGVRGSSIEGSGVSGQHSSMDVANPAVSGLNTGSGPGVSGRALSGSSVFGWKQAVTDVGPGVSGLAPGQNAGVLAQSGYRTMGTGGTNFLDGGLALDVVGKARFSACGAGNVGNEQDTATVSEPLVTSASHLSVTFMADPGDIGTFWVQRDPGTGFVLHLSKKTKGPAAFTYLVVEPGV